jgi:hypothetical protein
MSENIYGPGSPCNQCGEEIGVYAPDGADECGRCSDDKRPNNGIKEGLCCLECHSVIFDVGKLIRHVENRDHYWYKSGEDLVLNAKTLVENGRVFEE